MRRLSRYLWVSLAVAVAGVLIGGAGWAIAASTTARPVNAQIVANFAQFRRPRTAADAVPASIRLDTADCIGPASEGGPHAAAIEGLEAYSQIQCLTGFVGPLARGRVLRAVLADLQRDQSRAVRLPHRLGTIWLIPSGHWLCNLFRSRRVLGPHTADMACEPIDEVLAHPPLWPGGMWCSPCGPSNGADLFALEPDRFTNVTLGHLGGSGPVYLANNVVGACNGLGSAWLEQTGPTVTGTVTTLLGGGKLNGDPKPYHPRTCPGLP